MFDAKNASKELKKYEKKGPTGDSARLLTALTPYLPQGGFTHLDIGGGVGVLQHELAGKGAERTTAVDASCAYLDLLKDAATERNYVERQIRIEGDFTEVADRVESASVVTLDKVICCYPDMPALVSKSVEKATDVYAVVLPKTAAWVRLGFTIGNWFMRTILRWPFQGFLHSLEEVDQIVEERGFRLQKVAPGFIMCARVYTRG
jgi:magnesium-protoporphyrin O-methyltransferase